MEPKKVSLLYSKSSKNPLFSMTFENQNSSVIWRETGQYIVNNLENNLNVRKTKYIQCIDCGKWVEVDIKDSQTNRCKSCYTAYRKRYKAEKERNRRKRGQHN